MSEPTGQEGLGDGLPHRRRSARLPFVAHAATGGRAAATLQIEHQDVGDESWTTLTSAALVIPGCTTVIAEGLKERYRFTIEPHGPLGGDSMFVRALRPSRIRD